MSDNSLKTTYNRSITKEFLVKISESLFEIPRSFRADMRVPARIFANEAMIDDVVKDSSVWQIVNVSTLPGIVKNALCMPDIHQGYGFPIGGVAAFNAQTGIISPGGIGYDINCGVRLLRASVTLKDLKSHINKLADGLYESVPSGVGRGGNINLTDDEFEGVLSRGAQYMLEAGYGEQGDIDLCEERGAMESANHALVSSKARDRGRDQLGTLGSGNHFLEIQYVSKIYDNETARIFSLHEGQVVIMIHCGSRGLGHQVCTEFVKIMLSNIDKYGIVLPDRELACAPFSSPEGQSYYGAMSAAANFAWANRHAIAHSVREKFKKLFGQDTSIDLVYDVSHNIGKLERHSVDGVEMDLVLHRKGATRSFGPGRVEVPEKYREVGHPVLIPGTMGTASYILVGTEEGMDISFGSCCHGAGRRLSRMQAKKSVRGSELRKQLESQGIVIRCDSDAGLAEEAPMAYKDVDNVVRVVQQAGIAKLVAKVVPLGVVKGG